MKRDENLEGPPWWHTKATEFKITHCAEPLRAYIQGKVNGSWKQFAEAARDFCFFEFECHPSWDHHLSSLYQFRNNMFADYHAVTMNLLVEFKKAKKGVTKKEALTRRCEILKSRIE